MFGKSPHKVRRGKEVMRNISRAKHYNHYANRPVNEKAKKWFDRPVYGMPEKKEKQNG